MTFGTGLSRRERQIMEIVFREGRATAAEIQAALPDPPSYSAVRGLLRVLVEKGHLRHLKEGRGYVYLPTQPRRAAARSALRQVLRNFFGGSLEDAVAAFLGDSETEVAEAELDRLSALIEEAREGGGSLRPGRKGGRSDA